MSAHELNAFLLQVSGDPLLQGRLRDSDAAAASTLARATGFDVTVGDLMRYKARATTWQLSDRELEVVAQWQADDQSYWWQHIWLG
ncbi:MAG: Nif11-like leader peptide family RiPP precursor [Actinobacteria bacterium]|nr:Nif11-like leader peptide family RiPP precursor [Actinomycetota bacterium]